MAYVQLPSVNQGEHDMEKLVKQLLNAYIMLTEELTFLLNNLDTKNVNELNAEVITAGSITADKIQAGSITADRMNVNELSAITANLGHIISGLIESVEIYGSYIATRRTGYPRAEMSNIDNMFSASQSSTSNIKIEAVGRQASSPEMSVNSGYGSMTLFQQGGQSAILASGSTGLSLFGKEINLSPLSSGMVNVPFSQLFDLETGKSLREQLDR